MEDLKQLLSRAPLLLELETARANVEAERQLQETRLLQLEELLIAIRREQEEARQQLLKLEVQYSNMVTNTQQYVVMSSDRSQWPDTKLADQFCWNSTYPHQFDLRPDVHCSNLVELQGQPLYDHHEQQLSFVEQQEPEQQHQIESHIVPSAKSILGCTMSAEAELEVRQSALPERGKLLQAVMQAGPLLQTLLLTGPLPKWRNPPPCLDSVEIPKLSMCFSSNPRSVGPLVHHVPNPHGPANALDPPHVNSAVSSSLITGCAHVQ